MEIQSPVSGPPAADGPAGGLQYDLLQLFTRERSSSRGVGGFGEDLDILGDLTSTYNRHDFVLVHVAEKISKKVTGFGSLPTANRGERVGSYDRSICPLSGGISSLVTATQTSTVAGML